MATGFTAIPDRNEYWLRNATVPALLLSDVALTLHRSVNHLVEILSFVVRGLAELRCPTVASSMCGW